MIYKLKIKFYIHIWNTKINKNIKNRFHCCCCCCCFLLFFVFVITEITIIVTVVIMLTWRLIKTLNFSFVSLDSHLFYPPKKCFWGTTMEIKPRSFFVLSLPSHLVCFFFLISILHYNLAFDCKFIWKSYANFSFIELIFVMVKDTYLMQFHWTYKWGRSKKLI